jgi:hypothetical protein
MAAQRATLAQRYHKIDNVMGGGVEQSPTISCVAVTFVYRLHCLFRDMVRRRWVHIQQPFRAWGGWPLPQNAIIPDPSSALLFVPSGSQRWASDGTVDAAHELVSRSEVETKCLTITGNEQTGWFPSPVAYDAWDRSSSAATWNPGRMV